MDWDRFIRAHVHPMAPYAPGLREEQVRAIADVEELVKVSSNEFPLPPFDCAQVAGQCALETLNRYPDGGCVELKAALSKHMGVDEQFLVVGNGSNELLVLIAYATLGPGDEIVYGWPSFIVYPMMAQLTGATAVEVPLDNRETFDLEAIAEAITPATKMVVLCNPNNPTGTIYDTERFSAFLEKVPPEVLLVVDEAYFEFVTDSDSPDALKWFDGVRPLCVLRTFSKIYGMAGIRCGYAVVPGELAVALDKVRAPFNVNSVAQSMACASLTDTETLVNRKAMNEVQRERLQEAFDRLGVVYAPSQTNFVWIHVDDATALFEALLKKGIITRSFGLASSLRVGIGSESETTRIITAFEDLKRDGFLR